MTDSPAPFMPVPLPVAVGLTQDREVALRRAIVAEAISWEGTPYVQQGDVKGPSGAVDCAMLLVRCWVDTGIFQPFDPRPYPPHWHLHHDDERYLRWMEALSVEVETPQVGDVAVFFFGRCYSHGSIVVAPDVVCNSSSIHRKCTRNDISEAWLSHTRRHSKTNKAPRPVKFFDVFAKLRAAQ